MFEEQTYEVILQRMLDRIPDIMDKRESSPIYAALAPAAVELGSMYIAFDSMLNETFAETASRDFLIRLCADRGIMPKRSTQAVLELDTNRKVPDGMRFTGGGNTYLVTGEGQVTCEQFGAVGNEYLGDVIPVEYIDGLMRAAVTKILVYGEDEEGTESLRKKYYESFNERAFSGNAKDYRDKALAISGVGAVKVVRAWNGPGTVKLVVLDSAHGKATNTLLAAVQNEFDPNGDGKGDGLAPIGHVVMADTAKELKINITTTVYYDTGCGINDCKNGIEEAIEGYLKSLREKWENRDKLVVRIASIDVGIMNVPGVVDVAGTKINGLDGNLELSAYQIPVFGVVSYGK